MSEQRPWNSWKCLTCGMNIPVPSYCQLCWDARATPPQAAEAPTPAGPQGDLVSREAEVRVIEDHQAQLVCNDNCWTEIKKGIRALDESTGVDDVNATIKAVDAALAAKEQVVSITETAQTRADLAAIQDMIAEAEVGDGDRLLDICEEMRQVRGDLNRRIDRLAPKESPK